MLDSDSGGDFLRSPLETEQRDEERRSQSPGVDTGRTLGEFELVRELGRGGSGVVWLARQPGLDREVALKILPSSPATSARTIERFEREARNVAKLRHPGIVSIYSVDRVDGLSFFAMEYVPGQDLARLLIQQRQRVPTAALPRPGERGRLSAVARCIASVADALEHAHSHGLVHRDVKPQNLLVREDGSVVLADFGLARAEDLGSITKTGELAGTLNYMSPEQLERSKARVDHRTDIFSLGVVLYEMLSLERPFGGTTFEQVATRIQRHEPRSLRRLDPRIPRDLATICRVALEKDPADRYASAGAMAEDLRRYLDREPIRGQLPSLGRRAVRSAWRHRWATLAVLSIVVASVLAGWWGTRIAEVRAEDRLIAPLGSLVPLAAWDDVDVDALLEARRVLREHRALAVRRLGEGEVKRLERSFEDLRDRWGEAGLADVRAGLQGDRVIGELGVDGGRVMRGVLRLSQRSTLFPELEPLTEQALLPTVEVVAFDSKSGRPVPGRARSLSLDPVTGLARGSVDLGPLPVRGARVELGACRIVVELEDGRQREFSRTLTLSSPRVRVECAVRPGGAEEEEMILVAGRTFEVPSDGSPHPLSGRRVSLESFWIDRYEVRNADYREFLLATGHREPPFWSRVEAGSEADELPVTCVSWEDARAYAEWCGKRLPSHAEMILAARGPEGWRFPWAPDGVEYRGNTGYERRSLPSAEEAFGDYLLRAAPVTSHPEAATPGGLHHVLGNVDEWTETLFAAPRRSRWESFPQRRIVYGDWWCAAERGADLSLIGFDEVDPEYLLAHTGFRCARSQ